MDNILTVFLGQLVAQSPTLIVCLAGMIAAPLLWQRCPLPAMLTLIGMAVLLVTAVARSFLIVYLSQARISFGWDIQQYSKMLAGVGITASVIQGIALGLVLAAVFIDRKAENRVG